MTEPDTLKENFGMDQIQQALDIDDEQSKSAHLEHLYSELYHQIQQKDEISPPLLDLIDKHKTQVLNMLTDTQELSNAQMTLQQGIDQELLEEQRAINQENQASFNLQRDFYIAEMERLEFELIDSQEKQKKVHGRLEKQKCKFEKENAWALTLQQELETLRNDSTHAISNLKEQLQEEKKKTDDLVSDLHNLVQDRDKFEQENKSIHQMLLLAQNREQHYLSVKQVNAQLKSDYDSMLESNCQLEKQVTHLQQCVDSAAIQLRKKDLYIEVIERYSSSMASPSRLSLQKSDHHHLTQGNPIGAVTNNELARTSTAKQGRLASSPLALLSVHHRQATINPNDMQVYRSVKLDHINCLNQSEQERSKLSSSGGGRQSHRKIASVNLEQKQQWLLSDKENFMNGVSTKELNCFKQVVASLAIGRLHQNRTGANFESILGCQKENNQTSPNMEGIGCSMEQSAGGNLANQLEDCGHSFNFNQSPPHAHRFIQTSELEQLKDGQGQELKEREYGTLESGFLAQMGQSQFLKDQSPQSDEIANTVEQNSCQNSQSQITLDESEQADSRSQVQQVSMLVDQFVDSFAKETSTSVIQQDLHTTLGQIQPNCQINWNHDYSRASNAKLALTQHPSQDINIELDSCNTPFKNTPGNNAADYDLAHKTTATACTRQPSESLIDATIKSPNNNIMTTMFKQPARFETHDDIATTFASKKQHPIFEPLSHLEQKNRYKCARKSKTEKMRTAVGQAMQKVMRNHGTLLMDPKSTFHSVMANTQIFTMQEPHH